MKILALLAAVAATGLSGGAFAQTCPGTTPLTSADITGSTVCVGVSGAWEAQEMHYADGILMDYKKGTDKLDPTEKIGTWSISGNTVTYNYTGGTTYTYKAYLDGTKVLFCPDGSGTQTTGTLKTKFLGSCG